MTKYHFKRQIVYSLFILVFYNSCDGQVKTESVNDLKKTDTSTIGSPKLLKIQGSGLSKNVHCSLKDKQGNLWFGTTGDGVYCYDGEFFTQFTIKDGLSNNFVYSILEDNDGNIWFGTSDGISKFDGENIVPVPLETTDPNNTLTGNLDSRITIGAIMQSKNGTLWFGTNKGVYNYKENLFSAFLNNKSIVNKNGLHLTSVERMLEDRNGNIWFCSGMEGLEGISRYDGKFITNYKPNGDVWVPYLLEDKTGNIWFSGRSHGYFRYNGKTFTDFTENIGFSLIKEDKAEKICLEEKVGFGPMLEDKAGNIWFTGKMSRFGGSGGIWRYDGKSCTNFTQDGFEDYQIWSMVEDKAGNIWIGTNNTGLFRFNGKTFSEFSEKAPK
ncbi:Two component regulator propeller [Maribacter sedimenticola]|uniref:Two component regulator propeller n=1 Tax=Maribacter sedimenticola TaxID=228956 RepID=A0ABY1SJP4_9FLAO|nr:two-component regulator propeller domain-containing protein [Maribacter sedimenticola]SNR63051.1 Two component regulator propeller [Maribacter sedimenticola]